MMIIIKERRIQKVPKLIDEETRQKKDEDRKDRNMRNAMKIDNQDRKRKGFKRNRFGNENTRQRCTKH